ncbi:MAG TPA: hypothetical protein VK184_10825 [Nostocaceae cyanobacterium]|nr:hypothetical protein [Nostocaceae cyanobacterium]
MNQIQLTFVLSYLVMSCYFFINWLRFSLSHPTNSPEDRFLSFVMFVITTIFWPVMIPLSCIEICQTRKLEFSTVIPVLLAMFAFSISFYLN